MTIAYYLYRYNDVKQEVDKAKREHGVNWFNSVGISRLMWWFMNGKD